MKFLPFSPEAVNALENQGLGHVFEAEIMEISKFTTFHTFSTFYGIIGF